MVLPAPASRRAHTRDEIKAHEQVQQEINNITAAEVERQLVLRRTFDERLHQLRNERIDLIAKQTLSPDFLEEFKLIGDLGNELDRWGLKEITPKMAEQINEIVEEFRKLREETRALQADPFKGAIDGLRRFQDEARDVFSQVSDATQQAFNALTNTIVDFALTGKLQFRQFAESVVRDLLRILVMQQLLQATGFFFGGGRPSIVPAPLPPGSGKFARGAVFDRGDVQPFAHGGVITHPTLFPLRRGAGLAGEAGPEAVLPLTRLSDGKLGVSADGGAATVINVGGATVHLDTPAGGAPMDPNAARRLAQFLDAEIQKTIVRILREQQRPNGQLDSGLVL